MKQSTSEKYAKSRNPPHTKCKPPNPIWLKAAICFLKRHNVEHNDAKTSYFIYHAFVGPSRKQKLLQVCPAFLMVHNIGIGFLLQQSNRDNNRKRIFCLSNMHIILNVYIESVITGVVLVTFMRL